MKLKGCTLVLVVGVLLLSGCAGQEMSRRSLVTALEVKMLPQGCQLTVEYLKKTAADEEQQYGFYQGMGRTFLEAIRQIEEKEGASLYLDSTKCFFIDGVEDKDVLTQLLREVDKDGRLRPHVQVAFSRGTLADRIGEDFSIGHKATQLLGGDRENLGISLKDAINCLIVPGRGGMVPIVLVEEEECRLDNFILLGEKVLTTVEQGMGQSMPLRFLRKEKFVVTGEQPGLYDVQLEKTGVSIRCRMEAGRPYFVITARVSGYLRTAPRSKLYTTTSQLAEELTDLIEEEFAKVVEGVVHGMGTDIFSLGKNLSLRYPKEWKGMSENWDHILQNVDCEIIAKVKIQDKRKVLGK